MKSKTLWVASVTTVLMFLCGAYLLYTTTPDRFFAITNFEECVAAGNAVMESYPRQCSASGETFVETVKGLPIEMVLAGQSGKCLPKKDTDGPVTLECVIGFETDTGEYYALDIPQGLVSQEIMSGASIVAKGIVVPVEALSSNQWQTYDIAGIFTVTAIISVNGVSYDGSTGSNAADDTETTTPNDGTYRPYEPLPPRDEPVIPPAAGGCYVGGCSSQVCSDRPDVITTCEWREEYACYREGICERQPNGQCGWSETQAMQACMQGAISY